MKIHRHKLVEETLSLLEQESIKKHRENIDIQISKENMKNVDDRYPCLLCPNLYKGKTGLKIHCKRKDKNEDFDFMLSNSTTKHSIESLPDKLSSLNKNVKVLKRIPKAARIVAVYSFAKVLKGAAENNDSSSWEELLLFPFKSFPAPTKSKQSLSKLVKNNMKIKIFHVQIKQLHIKQLHCQEESNRRLPKVTYVMPSSCFLLLNHWPMKMKPLTPVF